MKKGGAYLNMNKPLQLSIVQFRGNRRKNERYAVISVKR